jgi:hypothetical protein
MANTYDLISSITVGSGGTSNMEFTSIPATYTDLLVKLSLRTSSSSVDMIKITFNNTTANYSYRMIYYNGGGLFSYNGSGQSFFEYQFANGTSTTANTFSNGEFYISNYAGSTNKPVSLTNVTEDNSSTAYITPMALLWSNSSAITSIKLVPNTGPNFLQYSTAYLYGIKNT